MPNFTQVELALGAIKISFVDSSTDEPITYFGMISSFLVRDSEQLKTFYAPDDSSDTLRARFGALSLQGSGQITLGGVLASTRSDSEFDFCSGFNNLVEYSITRKIWEEIQLKIDFSFDDDGEGEKTYLLYDGKVGQVNMGVQGNMLHGKLTLQYSHAEPDE